MLNLLEVLVQPVLPFEEQHFQKLMQKHHYLGALPKISETLWHVVTFADQWVALLSGSALLFFLNMNEPRGSRDRSILVYS